MLFFFFQAEDGIRGAQESRGLGDVYKRQEQEMAIPGLEITLERADGQLLCSVPPNTALTGTRLSPPLSALVFDQRIAGMPLSLSLIHI